MNPTFIPSEEQRSIFEYIANPASTNLIINAVAGSGKSTTIVEALKHIPKRNPATGLPPSVLFLAFNKNIVEALKPRVPASVNVRTTHSLGLSALTSFGIIERGAKASPDKVMQLLWRLMDRDDPDTQNVKRLVSLGKSQPTLTPDWRTIIDTHDLDFENENSAVGFAQRAFDMSNTMKEFDFDDMIYWPVVKNIPLTQYDYVFVDEGQDLNAIQIELIARLMKPPASDGTIRSRLVIVGDRRQAIYGFRGAGIGALEYLAQRFQCTELPLSVSFRCARNIVLEAQKYFTT